MTRCNPDRLYLEPNIKVLDFILRMAEKPHRITKEELMNELKDKEEIKRKLKKTGLDTHEIENISDMVNKYQCLVDQDQENLDLLEERLKKKDSITLIPYLESDVHDLSGLAKIGEYLI